MAHHLNLPLLKVNELLYLDNMCQTSLSCYVSNTYNYAFKMFRYVYSKQSSLLVRRQEMALLLILAAIGLMVGSVCRTCHGQIQQNETDSAMNGTGNLD